MTSGRHRRAVPRAARWWLPFALSFLLLAPPAAPAAEPPPLTAAALQAWVTGYVDVMPAEKRLIRYGPASGAAPRGWNSERHRALAQACRAERGACRQYLVDAAQTLFDQAAVSRADLTYRHVALLSAYADLCLAIPKLAELEEDGLSCPYLDTVKFLHVVAELWNRLGYDDLFLHYARRYIDERSLHLKWVKAHAGADLARVERELAPVAGLTAADLHEKAGRAGLARFALIATLQPDVLEKKDARFRLVVRRLERLAWEAGEREPAERWARVLRELGPATAADCRDAHEAWRTALARQIALGLPPDALREPRQPCDRRFQDGLPEAAAQLLQYPTEATRRIVTQALRTRRAQCASIADACAPATVARIGDLLDLASADRERLAALGQRAIDDLRLHAPTRVDQLVGWAAGLRLLAMRETRDAGKTLLEARIAHAGFADKNEHNPAGATLHETVRHAEHVQHYLADLARHGEPVELAMFEQFRHRSLLRRLQFARRDARLDTPAGPARTPDQQALRKLIDDADAIARRSSSPLEQALGHAMSEFARFALHEMEIDVLATRAAQAAVREDPGNPLSSWAVDERLALQTLENTDFGPFRVPDTHSLATGESYMGWLKVPGGFVVMLAAARQYGDHELRSRFVPFAAADERDLSAYLALLQSDLGARRGGTLVPASVPPQASAPSFARLQAGLSQRLIAPFAEDLRFTARLVIAPDASLARLPFETLTLSRQLLLNAKVVSYVQSLAMHAELKERAKGYRMPARVLSIAAPAYAPAGRVPADPAIPALARTTRWLPLDGAARESNDLFGPGVPVERWLGTQASRARVLAANASGQLAGYSVIHFATHAYVDAGYSALVLAADDGANGFLGADDVARLKLRSALVILSACSTAFGRSETGEGIVGLPYAFVQAGNINTIISLWPVDDEGAAAFVIAYTGRLRAGAPVQLALAQTKADFAAGRMGRRFARPQVWAAFVALGVEMTLP